MLLSRAITGWQHLLFSIMLCKYFKLLFQTLGWFWTSRSSDHFSAVRIKQVCRGFCLFALLFNLSAAFFATCASYRKGDFEKTVILWVVALWIHSVALGFCSFYWVLFFHFPQTWWLEVTLVLWTVSYTVGTVAYISDSKDKDNCFSCVYRTNHLWTHDLPAPIYQVFGFCKSCTNTCCSIM